MKIGPRITFFLNISNLSKNYLIDYFLFFIFFIINFKIHPKIWGGGDVSLGKCFKNVKIISFLTFS